MTTKKKKVMSDQQTMRENQRYQDQQEVEVEVEVEVGTETEERLVGQRDLRLQKSPPPKWRSSSSLTLIWGERPRVIE